MRRALWLFPLLAPGCVGLGCGRSSGLSGVPVDRDTLVMALHNEPPTIDPGTVQDVDAAGLLQDVYEGLTAYDAKNAVVPMLASQIEVKGNTVTFRLKDATFHDGTKVTSEDFRWTWERNLAPKLASPTAISYLGDIVGAVDYNGGKAKSIRGIACPNPQTLVVTLDRPRAYFLGKLTHPSAAVMSRKAVGSGPIVRVEQSVGTGPYRMVRYEKNQVVELEKHNAYHLGTPSVDKIRRPIIKDAATRLSKYKSDGLDVLTLERVDVKGVANDPALKPQMRALPRPAIYFIAPNPAAYPPFRDERVRRAFAMAIDRRRIAEEVIGLPAADGLVPAGITGLPKAENVLPFDVAAARKLLADAGFPGGKGLPPVSIVYRAGRPDSERLAAAAVTDLRTNLGVKVDGKGMEFGALLENRRKGTLQMASLSWFGDYLDAENFLSTLFRTGASQNHERVSVPELDAMLDQADASASPAERTRLYTEADRLLVSRGYRWPVYFAEEAVLVKPWVKELETNLFGTMPHRNTRVD